MYRFSRSYGHSDLSVLSQNQLLYNSLHVLKPHTIYSNLSICVHMAPLATFDALDISHLERNTAHWSSSLFILKVTSQAAQAKYDDKCQLR